MNLREMLAATARDFLDDRTDLVDGEADSIFSDETLVRYFNAAEQRLCRRAWVLQDIGHPQAGVVVLVTDKATYKLHKSVLAVLSATPADTDFPLNRSSDNVVLGVRTPEQDFWDVNRITAFTPGRPLAITADAGTRTVRFVPTPSSTENGLRIGLKVARMPYCPLSLSDLNACPEVPEEWHLLLCEYAAGKCLMHPNVDASAKTEGRNILADVEAKIKEARQEMNRLMLAEAKWVFASDTSRIA